MTLPRTAAEAVTIEGERVKGSRFIAHVRSLGTETTPELAKLEIAALKALEPTAAHHGYAFRIGPDNPDFGWSDGGEPVGSAGRPILQRLDSAHLLNTLVLVSRLAAGQKLSATDLAHGYGEAARLVLAEAGVTAFTPTRTLELTFDYTVSGPVSGVLSQHRAIHVSADYGTRVTQTVRIPSASLDLVIRELTEATAARIEIARQ
jgi:putative IMPACT (imprinted ancient) family translation regulator